MPCAATHLPGNHLTNSHSFAHHLSLPMPSSSSSLSLTRTNTTTNNPLLHSSLEASSPYYAQGPFLNTLVSNTYNKDNNNNQQSTSASLFHFWRQVQGCNHWENLLHPLHPLLRQEIIRYGEFVRASYKAFDLDPTSNRYLNCKYAKNTMFNHVGMPRCGYQVTKYIYATPPPPPINIIQTNSSSSSARWIGYVAVSSDESLKRIGRRDIVITFRGTVTNLEWISNLMSALTPANLDPQDPRPDVQVESGFLSLYTSDEQEDTKFGLQSCREQLLSEVSRLLRKHKGESVSISLAGHSLGSALALLLAYDIAELGLNSPTVPITVFSFGGPRVGNLQFKKRCDELGVKVLRIANVKDPITNLPGLVLNENNFRVLSSSWSCSCYAHVGVELLLDFFNVQNPSCVHDLDTYIGLLRSPTHSDSAQQQEALMKVFMEKASQLVSRCTSQQQNNMKMLPQVFSNNPASWLASLSTDIYELLLLALLFSSSSSSSTS
ncbi:hypothetical protein PIB30_065865 [Stylosanthes scabra]|uniref:Fungal lipase-type domain-containing protein n=1 Tax=Stylosanthes scabra TaxID=79078 RepID=A0ABU6RME8_9FABA|nr:hypothetical protein [Stylosanthes scabra]